MKNKTWPLIKKYWPYVAGGAALVLLIWDPFRWKFDALVVYIILWLLALVGWYVILRKPFVPDHASKRRAPVFETPKDPPPKIPEQRPAPTPEKRSDPPQGDGVQHYVKIQVVSDAMKKRMQDTIYDFKHDLKIPLPDDSFIEMVERNGRVWLAGINEQESIRSIPLEPNCIYPIYLTVNRNEIVVFRLTVLEY